MSRPLHRKAHANCPFPNWAACDKNATDLYADWQAMQQVLLAYKVVVGGRTGLFRKDTSHVGQLVRIIAGEQHDILNDDGNSSQAPWVMRLRAAVERVKAGDLPEYNLYAVPGRDPATKEA